MTGAAIGTACFTISSCESGSRWIGASTTREGGEAGPAEAAIFTTATSEASREVLAKDSHCSKTTRHLHAMRIRPTRIGAKV